MPIAKFQLPDGRIGRFEVPEGTSPEQAMELISTNLSTLLPKPAPEERPSLGGAMGETLPEAIQSVAVPKKRSVLEGVNLGAPPVDYEMNRQAMLNSVSPESVMYEPGRQREEIEQTIAMGKAKQEAKRNLLRQQAAEENYTPLTAAQDTAVTFGKGIKTGIGEPLVGIWDLLTFGAAGRALEDLGVNPQKIDKFFDGMKSATSRNQEQNVAEAEDFVGEIKALAVNPAALINSIVESIPGIVATGFGAGKIARTVIDRFAKEAAAKGLVRTEAQDFIRDRTIATLSASAAEGLQTAGSVAEAGRQSGQDFGTYAPAAIGAGVTTAAISGIVNKFAAAYGVGDLQTHIAAKVAGLAGSGVGKGLKGTGFIKELLKEGAKEGVFQEMPQSATEQIFNNLATGKPWDEGVDKAAAQGLVLGASMAGIHVGASRSSEEAAKLYQKSEFGRNRIIAKAIQENVNQGNFSAENIKKEAIARLNPNSYNQELVGAQETTDLTKKLPQAPTPPQAVTAEKVPEQPTEAPVPPQVAPQTPAERKIVAPSESQDTQAMMDELLGTKPPEPTEVPIVSPELGKGVSQVLPPKVEVTHAYPMGENTEYQVLKTPTGYVANLFDKDAGKYVLGSARGYSIQTFGADAEIKANEFAQEQMRKAAKFNPPAAEQPQVAPTPSVEAPKAEEPKPETNAEKPKKTFNENLSPGFQEVYQHHLKSADAANKARSMVRAGTATQAQAQPFIDQSDKARSDMYESLFKERDNLSPDNKETVDLAQRAVEANQRGFAEGMLNNLIKDIKVTPQNMEFYRSRVGEFEAQAKPKETKPVKETYNLETLLENQPLDQKRLQKFAKFDERTVESLAKTNEYLQKLTDAINAKGFTVFESNKANMSEDVKTLKTAFTNLYAGASRVLLNTQHTAGKQARKNNKSPGEQNIEIQEAQKKLNKAHIEQNKDIQKARELLGDIKRKEPKTKIEVRKPVENLPFPEEQEFLQAQQESEDILKEMRKVERQKGSLFGSLRGTLNEREVNDIRPKKRTGKLDEYTALQRKGGDGAYLSTIVSNGLLNDYLPPNMQPDSGTFDEDNSVEYIKEKLRNKRYETYASVMELKALDEKVEEIDKYIKEYLELKDVNFLIQEAANEQREADIAATAFESEGETKPAPERKRELELRGETPEEVRAKEKEKEDRAKAEKEAEAKAKADEGVAEFALTGSNRPADVAAAKGQESLFGESTEQKALAEIKQDLVKFASGMSGISDLETGARARAGHLNHGVGVDVGLLSNNAIDAIASAALNSNVPIFIDSGAFSNFKQQIKGNGPKPLDFNKILAKYDQITEAIQDQNVEEKTDYPRPIIVMPDVVGDQAASLELIKQHKNWIIPELKFNVTQPMIPIQRGELTLSQVYKELVDTLGTDDFIVGVPSQAEAISKNELTEFLRESQPKKIHFLGAASDKKLTPLLNIVATESPNTKVTADASKVRSAILDGVANGKTREQAIMDALMEEEDPGVLLDRFGPQLTDESNVIDGTNLIREIGKEKQLELIADETKNLTEKETAVLEEEYGSKSDTDEFLQRLHDDVINFITNGASSVKNKIRGIINKIANSLLSAALVFNPNFVTKPEIIAVPQYQTRTETVYAEVPAEAKAKMSPAAQEIYSVVYPALKEQLVKNDKFFIVTDKPMARTFIFNPDGSLLLDRKVLLSKSLGDFLPAGSNEIDANKITPAGLYDLGLRDATRSKGEAKTAGEYDYGKVFVIERAGEGRNGPYSMTIMHSVWTHEKDAAQRLAALKTEAPNVSRYSFGCINVDKATFGDLVKNHLSQMDGAKLFIVPDSATNAMDFVNGKATYREDMIRQRVEPLTKEVTTPVRKAEKPSTQQMAAKEEEFQAPLNQRPFEMPLTPSQPTEDTFPIDRKAAIREYAKVKARRAYMMREVAKQGSNLTLQQELSNLNDLAKNLKDYIRDTKDEGRTAGDFDTYARILLNRYEKNPNDGISKDVYDVVNTAYKKYPFLLEGLKLSFLKMDIFSPALGEFDPIQRIVTLYKTKDAMSKPEIIRHELVHSMEQLMSDKAKLSVIEAWEKDFKATMKKSQTPEAKAYFEAIQMFFENPSIANYDQAVAAIPFVPDSGNKQKDRDAFNNWYQFMNPSEYWAVNAERLMARKLGSGWDRFVLAMKRLYEGLKKVIGVSNQSDIYKAFNEIFAKQPTVRDAGSLQRLATGMGVRLKAIQPPLFPNQPSAPQPQGQATPQQTQMFGGLPPGKRNIFGAPATPKSWELQPESKIGSLVDLLDYKIADKHVDTRKVQQAITKNAGAIDDVFNVYMKEELYHGRAANEIKDFLNGELSPIVSDLIKEKMTIDDLEEYLHNRHAEERNDAIAKINARFADVDNEPGSGIGTQAAKDYFKNLDPTKAAKLAKIAAKVDDITKGTQNILVDRGLETKETIDTWNKAYKHYVPLMRDQEELDFMHHGSGLGKGFQVKGGASKRAYGSTKSVVDILANIAIQRETAIIRSEKAKIGRALYGLVLQNPNSDFWFAVNPDAVKNKGKLYQELIGMGLSPAIAQNFVQEPKSPSIDPLTGQVRYQINVGLRGSDNVFPVRINGQDRYIFFNTKDPKAVRMVQSLSNLDAQSLGGLLGTTALVTRWIASVNTQYNPVFGMINFATDVGGAMFTLTDTPLAGKQKEVFSHVFPAMYAIYGSERFARKNKKLVSQYAALYEQFRQAGGTTGYREAFAQTSFGNKKTSIAEKEWSKQTEGAIMKKARYIFDVLSDYNEAMENSVRLAVFKTALDAGLSVEKAASLGKNITVNFNRKGQSTPILQALFAFFNASVRGTILTAKVLNSPAGRKIIAGGLAVGVFEALAMAMAGFDNDDPPDYVKDKNFVIPTGDGKYFLFPMPRGYNVIPGVARIATEYVLAKNKLISGGKPATEAATQVMTLMLDAFNPLGGGSMLQMVTPTALDPLAAATMNKDAFGRPIYKEDAAMKQTPGFTRSRENASTVGQWISEFLNYVSSPSGTKYTKGSISPTADEIDYYAGQVGGGAAREAIKGAETVKSWFTSEPQPIHRVPIVGRFYGDTKSQSAIQNKFYNNVTLMNKYANEVKKLEENGQNPAKFFKAYPAAVLYEEVNGYYNEVNQMNTEKKEMLKAKVPLKEIQKFEQSKTQLMKEFNDQVRQVQRR